MDVIHISLDMGGGTYSLGVFKINAIWTCKTNEQKIIIKNKLHLQVLM
jgi:hypothetical protein